MVTTFLCIVSYHYSEKLFFCNPYPEGNTKTVKIPKKQIVPFSEKTDKTQKTAHANGTRI